MYLFYRPLCISKLPGRLFLEVLSTGCALNVAAGRRVGGWGEKEVPDKGFSASRGSWLPLGSFKTAIPKTLPLRRGTSQDVMPAFSKVGILKSLCFLFEVGNSLTWLEPAAWDRGGKSIQAPSPSHCFSAINEDNRAGAIKIAPSHMGWGRFAVTLILKSYCITLHDGCHPLHGAKST